MDYNTNEKKKQGRKNRKIWWYKMVFQGRITDVTLRNFSSRPQILKLNKTQYVILKTLEVKEYRKKGDDELMRNRRSLQMIFKKLRQTINVNFNSEQKNQLAVTLTYRPNPDGSPMRDDKKLYRDFDKFMKRLRYHYSKDIDYIVIVEPQGWGAWHMHLLLKINKDFSTYIPHEEMEKLWGHGATRTERLNNVDQYGAYFVAYLSNLELTPENQAKLDVLEDDVEVKNGKRYIKGERLKWYPEYMQIWRHSKGIKEPKSQKGYIDDRVFDTALNKLGELTYEKINAIESDEEDVEIITRQYKKAK